MTCIPPLLTMDEVCNRLRVSRRWLQDFLKKHPHYLKAGNRYRFTEAHVQQIMEAMAAPAAALRDRRRAVPAEPSEAEVVRQLRGSIAPSRGSRKPCFDLNINY